MAQAETPVVALPRFASALGGAQIATATAANATQGNYSATDLSAFKADPDLFFEFSYRPTLQAMVDAIIAHEAPLREDVLGQRIARAHGWLRTGARIRDQIALHLRRLERTQESPGVFLWQPGTVSSRYPFRQPQSEEHRRPLSDICLPELVDFILSYRAALDEADPPLGLCSSVAVGAARRFIARAPRGGNRQRFGFVNRRIPIAKNEQGLTPSPHSL